MRRFARKHDQKLFLFGYQAIGGSEVPICEELSGASSVHEQMRPETLFNKMNIRHLFLDGDGAYNSGPISGKRCVVSGAFYNELDPEVNSMEEVNELFIKVRKVSEKTGFSVLRGYKEVGIALPTANLSAIDVQMQEAGDEEAKNTEISGKDLIKMAMESQFNDFRLRRDIGERVRERRLKHYKDCKVLSSLTRLLIMESTRLVSDPRKTTELIQYDIRTH